jgi:hypothetical protein
MESTGTQAIFEQIYQCNASKDFMNCTLADSALFQHPNSSDLSAA